MGHLPKLLAPLATLILSPLANATDVEGIMVYKTTAGASSADFGGVGASCAVSADALYPSVSKNVGYSLTLKAKYGPVAVGVVPPSSFSMSFRDQLQGAYSYVLFGSTTTHYSVSAAYAAHVDFVYLHPSISDSSGTIQQSAYEQSMDSVPKIVINGSGTVTVTPTWTTINNGNGTVTYTYNIAAWNTSGQCNATAQGFSPPPGPPGTQPAIPSDFGSVAEWDEIMLHFVING